MVKILKDKLTKTGNASEFDNMALVGILTTQILNDRFIENFDAHITKPAAFDIIFDRRSAAKNDYRSK
jgi:hypothetical protein